jgi:hypothetical protein
MEAYYRSIGVTEFKIMTDNTAIKPTTSNIKNALNWLTETNGQLFFHFSGHGSLIQDTSNDETMNNGNDSVIVTLDGYIVDDEFRTLVEPNVSSSSTLFAMFDSCNSGSGMDLRYQFVSSVTPKTQINNTTYNPSNWDLNIQLYEQAQYPILPGKIIYLSGCKDNQTSADAYIDNQYQGATSWSFLKALRLNQTITWRKIVKDIACILDLNNFRNQIPQLSSSVNLDLDSNVW